MQPVEKKIEILASRVDDVYHILDRLHQHLLPAGGNTWRQSTPTKEAPPQFSKLDRQESSDWLIHQDVLIDSDHIVGSYRRQETPLSPQSQIQRLTAQLTVAYSRIAALEEQLLARQRVH